MKSSFIFIHLGLAGLSFCWGQEPTKETISNTTEKSELTTHIQQLKEKEKDLVKITAFLKEQKVLTDIYDTAETCQSSIDEAVNLLSKLNTGGATLAAQSEVIEALVTYINTKNECKEGGSCSKKSDNIKQLLQQYLGLNQQDENNENQQPNEGESGKTPPKEAEPSDKTNDKPGMGSDGSGNINAEKHQAGDIENNDKKRRFIPKASGISHDEMPQEFQEIIDAYNKTLQN